MAAHQRDMTHFSAEVPECNRISPKQLELLETIGRGLRDKQIATELGISVSAVRQRPNSLIDRTGLTGRTALAGLAMSMGVLPDPLHGPDHEAAEMLIEMDSGGVRPG